MESAGRILLMPKGDYSASASYVMLDMVNHSGASWVCKKDCTGQAPSDSNTTYWQRVGTAVDMSAFFPKSGGTIEKADTVPLAIRNSTSGATKAYTRFYAGNAVLGGLGFSNTNKPSLLKSDGTEKELLTTDGGEVSANSAFPIGVKNTGGESCYTKYSGASGLLGYLGIRTGGEAAHMTKDGAVYNLLHTGNMASQVLPLNGGGTVTKNTSTVMQLKNSSGERTYLGFIGSDTLGYLGFESKDTPSFVTKGGAVKELLHTGNKPTGTYTGNGSNEQRTVNVGGTGAALLIYGSGYSMFATPSGAIGLQHSGGNIIVVPQTECKYLNGTLTLATANYGLNANNATYNYQLL